ncbi:ADP-ribosylglycohydrolase family protein [Cyanobacterium aponinum AL20118]|uniref:ADP-ribosylglycohydrolase family protein n=1 Tax=Cyanobacterium aponinum AL20115 TaxID=3090662 RepID=A0AAF0ZKL0_9CHRO|nr:ADP-ribosylglycohydrolase family protein [Cyanobacterium aponinum]WPF90362.1 ADP-ribosylglycohydrolase family protein [Cyanobacterium aponinum AL20115]
MSNNDISSLLGILIGTAIGDSVGLPAEGISRQRNHKIFRHQWHQRLLWRYGMISDDTEHTIFVAQCLIAHPNSSEKYVGRLAWCLRWWLLSLPAGVGLATLKSIIKLWLGFNPRYSGVDSAGNGAVMKSAIIGAFFAYNQDKLREYVCLSTRITHSDPRALIGAEAIASLTAWIIRDKFTQPPQIETLSTFLKQIGDKNREWILLVDAITESLKEDLSVLQFAEKIGQKKGVSGYVYHTVPVVIFTWYRHFGNFPQALSAIYDCGGDTDTTGAILGALMGATVGLKGIPEDWINNLRDYPRNIELLHKIAQKLSNTIHNNYQPSQPIFYGWWWVLPRNIIFLLIVLCHGFRRLFPPY